MFGDTHNIHITGRFKKGALVFEGDTQYLTEVQTRSPIGDKITKISCQLPGVLRSKWGVDL